MKIISILIVIMHVMSLSLFAQTKKVNIQQNRAKFDIIIKEFESQANLLFVYDANIVSNKNIYSCNTENTDWQIALSIFLAPLKLTYSVVGQQVIIKPIGKRKRYTISGYIKDKSNGESIGNATITNTGSNQNTKTNQYGFYSIALEEGECELTVFANNYGREISVFKLIENTQVDFALTEIKTNVIQNVRVLGKIKSVKQHVQSTEMGKIDISMNTIKKMPTIFGENDVLKVMQLMPGIKRGGEGNIGMYVRGGGSDENLIQLDEATVYNAGHLLGFFSVFNSAALKDVNFYKGGFPSQYGGRLSSIMDIRMKEGNNNKWQTEGSLGLISSNLTVQGPIIKNKVSFMLSGRRTYIDKVFQLVGFTLPYYFYDANAKLNWNIGKRDKIFVSSYFGNDVLKYQSDGKSGSDSTSLNIDLKTASYIGNFTSTVRWNHIFKNQKMFMNTTFLQTKFKYDLSFGTLGKVLGVRSSIQDVGVKCDLSYNPEPKHQLKFGAEIINHSFRPNIIQSTDSNINERISDGGKINNVEVAAYISDEWSINDAVKINYGLRNSSSLGINFAYTGLEPRANIRYQLAEKHSIKASYTRMRQNMHLVSSSSLASPTDLWYPLTKSIKPGISDQLALGYFTGIDKLNTLISVEGYYKKMHNLLEYREGAVLILNNNFEKELISGSGDAYGAELFVNKNQGKFTGWIGYTLSWATRQFDELNNGKRYYAKYDRRHDISLVAMYEITKRIHFSAVWVYASGNPFTPRIGQHIAPNPSYTGLELIPIYGAKNAYRLSSQHRLDFDITIKSNPDKRYIGEWHIGAYNVYNRAQPNRVSLTLKDGKYVYEQKGLFGVIPSIAYNFKF
jgi:TonB-dependent Receptor Plug Domain/Carboxypeptidase regulatory-like domain